MFYNPFYEYSLHHDDYVPNIKVHKDDTNLLVEFMDHPFKVQTPNPKSNSINTLIIIGKAFVGWHVLKVGGRFFWILINCISSQYTSVGWHFDSPFTHKFVKLIIPACKAGDAFLYVKFHPT
jgi:hypothetical protein